MRRMDGEVNCKNSSAAPQDVADDTSGLKDGSSLTEHHFGRLVIEDTRSCYVSNIAWASLSDEVEGLRDLLYESSSEAEEENDSEGAFTGHTAPDFLESLGPYTVIMGVQALASPLRLYHPPLSKSVALLEIFKESVVPLVHIFHMPSLMRAYWDAIASPETIDRNTEALLFAIYYSTVISMESPQCERMLGLPRATALKHYQFATQQAMARADLLNTQSLVLLQAVVLFLSALRNEDASYCVVAHGTLSITLPGPWAFTAMDQASVYAHWKPSYDGVCGGIYAYWTYDHLNITGASLLCTSQCLTRNRLSISTIATSSPI